MVNKVVKLVNTMQHHLNNKEATILLLKDNNLITNLSEYIYIKKKEGSWR